ncbi:uncharacterized protein LOC129582188 [Paramacrobiotus metropolitanus]|uniref:uncharacterized protein LOC129582188 n=1 Tax=Paramacrobiotus metropolitanus TaxID=2943436 RepID=UPI002446226A|nr:uncharacterized protein LOC129582188 [Paramacrobiotus metropolitanus]
MARSVALLVMSVISALLVGSCTAGDPSPPKPDPPTPKPPPVKQEKLPDNIRFFTVKINELWADHDESGNSDAGFFRDILDLIIDDWGYDFDVHKVDKPDSFDNAIKKMNEFAGTGIFLGAVEKDGVYKDKINFTVPVMIADYVQVFKPIMAEKNRLKLGISTLNFTNTQDTIANDPDKVKKLPPDQQASGAAGAGGKPADLKKALDDVQNEKSIFVGRTPVLEKMVLKYPLLSISNLGHTTVSSFGVSKSAKADPAILEKLNTTLMKLHRNCSIYKAYVARFPMSAYRDPTDDNSGNGRGNNNCEAIHGRGPGNGGGDKTARAAERLQSLMDALKGVDSSLLQNLVHMFQSKTGARDM